MIVESGEIEVLWTCGACQKTNELMAPIWKDIYGEYVPVECPDCSTIEYVSLDNLEGDE